MVGGHCDTLYRLKGRLVVVGGKKGGREKRRDGREKKGFGREGV